MANIVWLHGALCLKMGRHSGKKGEREKESEPTSPRSLAAGRAPEFLITDA